MFCSLHMRSEATKREQTDLKSNLSQNWNLFLSLSSTVVSEGYFILETVSEHLISHHYSEFPSVPKPSRRKQICVQYSLVCDRLCPSSPLCSSGGSGTWWWSMKLTDWRTRIHCCTKPWAKWAALIWSKSVFLHIFNGLHSFFLLASVQFSVGFRVLLTGTPIQNNLQELYSLLSFIQPSIFAAEDTDDFLSTYSNVQKQPTLGTITCGGYYSQIHTTELNGGR